MKELELRKKLAERLQTMILSYTGDESRRSNTYSRFKLAKRNQNMINITNYTLRRKQYNKGKDHKFGEQKEAIHDFA